ncbi:MAG: hypothetical protein AAGG46_03060 [Planctomycetota bacterium]
MRVLIYEPQFRGHNLCYVARIARDLAALPCEVRLATSRQAIASEEFNTHLADVRAGIEVLPLEGFQTDAAATRVITGGLAGWRSSYRGLVSAVDRLRPDHVYVPYGNHLGRIAAAPFGLAEALKDCQAEAETLLVGGSYCYPQHGFAKRLRQRAMLELLARGPWRTVFHCDPLAVAEVHRLDPRVRDLVRLAPDPHGHVASRERAVARASFGLPATGRLVGIVALIEIRKGVDHLASALRQAGDRLRPDDRLALIGPMHRDVWALLKQEHADLLRAGRIVCADRFLTAEQMADAISSLDVMSVFYPHHRYTSSVLSASAKLGRPVIGARVGWIGRMIEQFDLGVTCDPLAPQEVADRLVDAFDTCDAYRLSERGRRFVEYISEENFGGTITARLRERLSEAPSPALRSWEWAVGGDDPAAAFAAA